MIRTGLRLEPIFDVVADPVLQMGVDLRDGGLDILRVQPRQEGTYRWLYWVLSIAK